LFISLSGCLEVSLDSTRGLFFAWPLLVQLSRFRLVAWESMLVLAVNKEQEDYGTLCHPLIAEPEVLRLRPPVPVNVPFVIQISRQMTASVIPKKRHWAVGKETGKTSHVERFNNTRRQRISCLVRSTLSFSKKLENHIGAIWYFRDYSLPKVTKKGDSTQFK